MLTTLTIPLDDEALTRAEASARAKGRSLAELIQEYIGQLAAEKSKPALVISPDILALQGSVTLPEGMDWEQARQAYLANKYLP
ncbi:DUF6364 family protein [Hymenobacter ruricola]|uniref:Antitoxin n=1 Tax=Hymenobacter ruricola TaxID=2791023 RepID=A0ABS0I560_9BACT|nr:DUF6364 family protein [Hymenobacter ruricola]MBF9222090.1 hypothetical protein [Hymenobacter ruricola]